MPFSKKNEKGNKYLYKMLISNILQKNIFYGKNSKGEKIWSREEIFYSLHLIFLECIHE